MNKSLSEGHKPPPCGRTSDGRFGKGNKLQNVEQANLTKRYNRFQTKFWTTRKLEETAQAERKKNPSKALDRVHRIWEHETPKKVEIDTYTAIEIEARIFSQNYELARQGNRVAMQAIGADIVEEEFEKPNDAGK
jgi:hypothetical protein